MLRFLELDGWRVRILDSSPAKNYEVIGDASRAFSGKRRSTRRALKRRFPGILVRSTRAEAVAFQSVILGLGDRWPFDYEDTARLVEDFFTTKGSPPSSDGAMLFGTAVDGTVVSNRAGFTESQFGRGSMAAPEAITNLLPADVRDVEGGSTAGFAAVVGGVISLETVNVLQGAQSLKVVSAASGDGAETNTIAASGDTDYVAVVYVKPTTDSTVDLVCADLVDSVGVIGSVCADGFDAQGQWVKLILTGKTAIGATTIKIVLTTVNATTFYADAFMIAVGDADQAVWSDGVRAASDPSYSASFLSGARELTINFWARGDTGSPAGTHTALDILDTGSVLENSLCLLRPNLGSRWRFTSTKDGVGDFAQSEAGQFDGDWHMVTGVYRQSPKAGENNKDLYVDGVLAGSSSTGALPDIADLDRIDPGHAGGVNRFFPGHEGLLDQLSIVPFAAVSDQILGWFNFGEALGELPSIKASGDCIESSTPIIAEGDIGW